MGILRDKLNALKAKTNDNLRYADPDAAKAEARDEYDEAMVSTLEDIQANTTPSTMHAELMVKLDVEFAALEKRIDAIEAMKTTATGAADPDLKALVDALMARMSVIEQHVGADPVAPKP